MLNQNVTQAQTERWCINKDGDVLMHLKKSCPLKGEYSDLVSG